MSSRARVGRLRRRRLRGSFDGRVEREWARYEGTPRRWLTRTLRERFLELHLTGRPMRVLELGPGPGRFTSILRRSAGRSVVAVDLSRRSLLAARRRRPGSGRVARVDWVQAAGERLPFPAASFDAVVAIGNVVAFAAREGPELLREVRRVARPGARLIADFSPRVAALQEFFGSAARSGRLFEILRRPSYYFVDRVVRDGYQPYAPRRLANWEFRFYTTGEASEALARAGFRPIDVMSVGPIGWLQEEIVRVARRRLRTRETYLRLEEEAGRRAGVHETGHGFLVAAVRG